MDCVARGATYREHVSEEKRRLSRASGGLGAPAGGLETDEGLLLVLEHIEKLDELRDREQVQNLLVRLENLHDPAALDHALVASDQLAYACGVHVVHLLHVQENLVVAAGEQVLDRLAHLDVSLAMGDAAG